MQALVETAATTVSRHQSSLHPSSQLAPHEQLCNGAAGHQDNTNNNNANNNNNLAHCVSCVFLNEIAFAKHNTMSVHSSSQNNAPMHLSSASPHNSSAATTTTLLTASHPHHFQTHHPLHQHHHHLHQQQHHLQHQQHQQQQHHLHQHQQQSSNQSSSTTSTSNNAPHNNQYNLNSSDYSSSTYHIYDQISDLIIIKQQRMERKRQLAHRRKLILLGALATILVVGSIYIIARLVGSIQTASSTASNQIQAAQQATSNQVITTPTAATTTTTTLETRWPQTILAPSGVGRTHDAAARPSAGRGFDGAQWQQQQQLTYGNNNHNVLFFGKHPGCPNNCTGRGVCVRQLPAGSESKLATSAFLQAEWRCQCHAGATGDDCSQSVVERPAPAFDADQTPLATQPANNQVITIAEARWPTAPSAVDRSPGQVSRFDGAQWQQQPQQQQTHGNKSLFHVKQIGCPNNCTGRGVCVKQPSESLAALTVKSAQASNSAFLLQSEWRCQCHAGASGDDCSHSIERQCDDKIDNDNDGLVDCADSECCADKACQNSTLCMKSPDPLDILMRKQPSPPTSSFFQRMQFLIEKSQTYSNQKDFNASRASVIRGRVTYMKQGMTGVKVSVAGQLNLGITLTRDNGYFDLMVNGGGAVLVEFRREPFAVLQKAVRVPWNEIVLMDPVELSLIEPLNQTADSSAAPSTKQPSCWAHNYRLMKPTILAGQDLSTPIVKPISSLSSEQQKQRSHHSHSSHLSDRFDRFASSSSSNQSSSLISLVYTSSRSNEFMSTITMQLTPEQVSLVPSELSLVHVKIVIEGNLFEQMFEPQANLSFTYPWNRRNVYRQKSFGLSTAIVSVGYEYIDCEQIVWLTKHVQVTGHDLAISDIGNGWNLNVHHRYNYRDAILQRGDGKNFDLKTDRPKLVQTLMGDGYQRQAICPYCDSGSTSPQEQRLYRPQALVASADGSLYVGDSNLIRRIERGGTVRTVLELTPQRTPARYSLALSPIDQRLYMVDPDRYQVYWVRGAGSGPSGNSQGVGSGSAASATLQSSSSSAAEVDPSSPQFNANDTLTNGEESLIPVIGSGLKCVWSNGVGDDSAGDESSDASAADRLANCGDGHLAQQARLIEPRALVFDIKGRMYLADGPNVRMIDSSGKIYTILGDYGQTTAASSMRTRHHVEFPCGPGETIPMHKFVPKMPLDLAINPIDETLHVLDDNVVYKITQDKRVQVVAGQLSHCIVSAPRSKPSTDVEPPVRATDYSLQSAQSIAFNQNGELFISEDDQKQALSRVLIVGPEHDTISLFAGLPVDSNAAGSEQQPQPQQQLSNLLPRLNSAASSKPMMSPSGQTIALGSSVGGASVARGAPANEYKFSSIEAIAIEPRGSLIVADKTQLRLLSVEPDLPQMNSNGEYEIHSPDNANELLVFNRFGHHTATRDTSAPQVSSYQQRTGGATTSGGANTSTLATKYTFTYTVNTSLGQLASVTLVATGNKMTLYREGPHHQVSMIETAKGQCKLDISRSGQVHSTCFGAL